MQGRAARRLAALAAPLRPERAPFYVRRPVPPGLQRTFPADGWYWTPGEHHTAVFLGASEIDCAIELHRQMTALMEEPAA